MTSAEFSCGLSGDRNSSRVLQPPGGISNIFGGCDDNQASGAASAAKAQQSKNTKNNIFGTNTEEPEKTSPVNNNKSSNVLGADAEGDQENQKTKKADGEEEEEEDENSNKETTEEETSETPQAAPTSKFAEHDKNLAASRGSINPITGEALNPQPNNSVHTSTRVRQPPGGASSGLW